MYAKMTLMGQPASSLAVKHPIAVGLGIVAAAAGIGAIVGAAGAEMPSDRKMTALGGTLFGTGTASLGGLAVVVASKRLRAAGLATALIGLGGVGAVFLGHAAYKSLVPGPAAAPALPPPSPPPGTNIVWTQIAASTVLQPNIIYRLSDVASAADLQNPPTVDSLQTYLGPSGFEVDGVWVGTPPPNWPAADIAGAQTRIYIEFWATKSGAQLPGLTSNARLFVQQASA